MPLDRFSNTLSVAQVAMLTAGLFPHKGHFRYYAALTSDLGGDLMFFRVQYRFEGGRRFYEFEAMTEDGPAKRALKGEAPTLIEALIQISDACTAILKGEAA